ncbi:prenylated Rab acceptor protein 1-like [Gracilinanus agilis]|uniref:prenylated Rab acceptor protein 1-like n=1 Tax=Gracilinanus agilis TaxID=191870 RepID=UPI001CFD8E24|nr:prenylated Rab acceptor protein 1-like [Gracilinanus agilis]
MEEATWLESVRGRGEAGRPAGLWEIPRRGLSLGNPSLSPPGREVTPAHQYGLAGGISFPFFWLAGAGSAVFWVLGATLVVIGSHAAFHQLEATNAEELQMEPV